MIKQIISLGLFKNFNGSKLEENNILQLCLHNVCIFSNYSFKDFKIVNLISISITMGERRYKTFVQAISKQYGISEKLNKI